MGCSASRLDTLLAKAIEDPSSLSSNPSSSISSTSSSHSSSKPSLKTRSLSAPLVHHPAQKKGDTHHIVSLTSSTYGSLIVVEKNPSQTDGEFDESSGTSSPDSVINTWELMEGLEGEDKFNADMGHGLKLNSLNLCDFDDTKKKPISRLGFVSGFGDGLKVNTVKENDFGDAQKKPSSKLGVMNGFVDDLKVNSFEGSDFKVAHERPSSELGLEVSDSVRKLSDSYVFVEMPVEKVEGGGLSAGPNSKPLWKHLSEESLLSKMDPNVASSYQRALSARKLGYEQPLRATRSVGSSPFVPKSKSVGSSPSISKLCSYDSCKEAPRAEDKIVLYFTSVRGIRRTYEDCCTVRMILRGCRVAVDEKDISMDSSYRKELQNALGGKAFSLPQLFIGGKHIGGADEIKQLHETGELEKLLDGFPVQDHACACERCGESRFIPCSKCHGSRKVYIEKERSTKRCPDCNENGLVRCPGCCS